MSRHRYQSGDTIVLKSRVLGGLQPEGPGRVLSALPEAQGMARYRVQFPQENYERSISQDDIDETASAGNARDGLTAAARGGKANWINPDKIRIRK